MRTFIFPWILAAAGSLLLSLILVCHWGGGHFLVEAEHGFFLRAYAYAQPSNVKDNQKISRRDGIAIAEYRVQNFNGDPFQIEFSKRSDQLDEYWKEYGYSQSDLDNLKEWQKEAFNEAYKSALNQSPSKSDLDRIRADIRDQYRQRLRDLMLSRGFKYQKEGVLIPDIPGIAGRNVEHLNPVAVDIDKIAKSKSYDSLEIVGAALSLMQTGLAYERVPLKKQDKTIGGIYPPVAAILEGRGDCDTKTALMASILLNWESANLIGVGMPNHYLIGVLRTPAKGDAFVEYDGLTYVLMEPSGPGRLPPGMVSQYTLEVLKAGDQIALDPLRKN